MRLALATTIAGAVLWSAPPAEAIAAVTCPQALLSFQWTAGEGIGASHPIAMSLGQCTTGFRSSALSYGSGTITSTIGTGAFMGNNQFFHYHVTLTVTVPDVALGPVSVTRSFDVEAAYLAVPLMPEAVWHYANSGPIFQGLVSASARSLT